MPLSDEFDNPFPLKAVFEMPDGSRREIPLTKQESRGVTDYSFRWACSECPQTSFVKAHKHAEVLGQE